MKNMNLPILKKIGLIIIIAILFSFLNFSIIDMIFPSPEYDEYCYAQKEFYPGPECKDELPTADEIKECEANGGEFRQNYERATQCPEYKCTPCIKKDYEAIRENHQLRTFLLASLFGVIAIILGMYIMSPNDVMKNVWTGILIAGIITIFIGTAQYFRYLGRFLKPIVLIAEIALIIWVAIKTSQKVEKSHKNKSKKIVSKKKTTKKKKN